MKAERRRALGQAQAQYRKWECSLEGVAYWLGDLPVSESLEETIIKAVHRLPTETREFVYDNCRFTSTAYGGVRIHHVSQASHPWLITLHEGHVDESLIIHEIAHAWLGHEYGPQFGELRVTRQDEEAACDLTRQWGFAGAGAAMIDGPH
jgi:hypothetical protein